MNLQYSKDKYRGLKIHSSKNDRRKFLKTGGLVLLGTTIINDKLLPVSFSNSKFYLKEKEEKVSPNEDLKKTIKTYSY